MHGTEQVAVLDYTALRVKLNDSVNSKKNEVKNEEVNFLLSILYCCLLRDPSNQAVDIFCTVLGLSMKYNL